MSDFKSGFGVGPGDPHAESVRPMSTSRTAESVRPPSTSRSGSKSSSPVKRQGRLAASCPNSAATKAMLASCSAPTLPAARGAVPKGISMMDGKPGTGRFYEEELTCFKKLAAPSSLFEQKEEIFWKSTGALRRAFSDSGLHMMPATKGNFWDAGKTELVPTDTGEKLEAVVVPFFLPMEEETGRVLDNIYPRSPVASPQVREVAEFLPKQRETRVAVLHSPPTKALPVIHHAEFARGAMRNRARLLGFRQKLMDKFSSTKNAFDTFCADSGGNMHREVRKKEFINFLNRHFGHASKEEQERIFDFLDMDNNGCVSMAEFHTALEGAQPMRTMEDLRRRLIALGATSMRAAMLQMCPEAEAGAGERTRARTTESQSFAAKRMSSVDFMAAMARVGIRDEEEVAVLFASVCPENRDSISFDELASSMAAVSPSLLLEDVRDKLLKKHSTLAKAYEHIDKDRNNGINIWEFRMLGDHLKMNPRDSDKLFRLIDVDSSGSISRSEFVSALQLSEPSLFLEEVRRKVRQRFRSILGALHLSSEKTDGEDDSGDEDPRPTRNEVYAAAFMRSTDQAGKTAGDLMQVLSTVQLTESDTQILFELIDANKDGQLTIQEFLRGIRIFAPSCMLEDLRLECLRLHGSVTQAFDSLGAERRDVVLDSKGLEAVFEELGMASVVDVRAVFDILESRRDGGVTCGEVASALVGAAPGAKEPLSSEARNSRARVQIHQQMAAFRRSADELRGAVRQKAPRRYDEMSAPLSPEPLPSEGHSPEQPVRRPTHRSPAKSLGHSSSPASPLVTRSPEPSPVPARRIGGGGVPPGSAGSTGSGQRAALVGHPATGQSYRKVSKLVGKLPEKEKRALEKGLHSYYRAAGGTIDRDVRLLSGKQSRFDHFRDNCAHKRVLEKPLV